MQYGLKDITIGAFGYGGIWRKLLDVNQFWIDPGVKMSHAIPEYILGNVLRMFGLFWSI